MIDFESSNSPYFVSNKEFIEKNQCELINFEFNGWCNAFGYEVIGTSQKNQLFYTIVLIKNQTTQNGVIIPVNARVNTETRIEVLGIKKEIYFKLGQNWFWKLLNRKLNGQNSTHVLSCEKIDAINVFSINNYIHEMTIKNGRLLLKTHNSMENPFEFINNLEGIINKLS